LREPPRKIAGYLIGCHDGQLVMRLERGVGETVLEAGVVETVDFAAALPPPRPRPPKPLPAPAPRTELLYRPGFQDRARRWKEFLRRRIEERLTPEEQTRFLELMERRRREAFSTATGAEQEEFQRLQKKAGLMDPDSLYRLSHEALRGAAMAQRNGRLSEFLQAHREALSVAQTEDDRRRHIAALFAAGYLQKLPPERFLRPIAEALASKAEARLRAQAAELAMQELQVFYEVFEDDVERGAPKAPRTPPPPEK
jgi:hypothetical protein